MFSVGQELNAEEKILSTEHVLSQEKDLSCHISTEGIVCSVDNADLEKGKYTKIETDKNNVCFCLCYEISHF
jgi:hypothetical protein